jgi:hypothetical protein
MQPFWQLFLVKVASFALRRMDFCSSLSMMLNKSLFSKSGLPFWNVPLRQNADSKSVATL